MKFKCRVVLEMQGGRDVHGLDCKDWMQTNAHEEERCKPRHDLKVPAVNPFPFPCIIMLNKYLI